MAAIDLCTRADVRQALELRAADTSRDPLIDALITDASELIVSEYEREFAPAVASATRRVRVELEFGEGHPVAELAPYDLRSATSVTLHPESASPQALTSDQYALSPVPARWGVYTEVRLSPRLSFNSQTALRFGYALLDIAGAWGFANVPPPTKRSCIIAVSSWLRRDLPALGLEDLDSPRELQQLPPKTLALPAAAHRWLNQFKRY